YVMVDDFCNFHCKPDIKPGQVASLTRSEVVTLAMAGQWSRFESEPGYAVRWPPARLNTGHCLSECVSGIHARRRFDKQRPPWSNLPTLANLFLKRLEIHRDFAHEQRDSPFRLLMPLG
nr:hypothetical protein [Ardenticatenaceae bacterium]